MRQPAEIPTCAYGEEGGREVATAQEVSFSATISKAAYLREGLTTDRQPFLISATH